jgi:hypothetical protein
LSSELAPEQTLNLRGYWALVRATLSALLAELDYAKRCASGSLVIDLCHQFTVSDASTTGDMIVVADVPVTVYLDDEEIGRQGGYDPYGSTVRVQPYTLPAAMWGSASCGLWRLTAVEV